MTLEEKRKKLETLPWQALFDATKLNGADSSHQETILHRLPMTSIRR